MKKKYLHQQNLEKWLKFEISKGRFMLENKKNMLSCSSLESLEIFVDIKNYS
jgi:hypothetical protein